MIKLINGDCLQVMDELIENGVKVDLILTDPPYGITRNKWDSVIPLDAMWDRIKKISNNENTPTIIFGNEPFTSILITSNLKGFKQKLIWDKKRGGSFLNSKNMILPQTEDIILFTKNGKKTIYNPQMVKLEKPRFDTKTSGGVSINYDHKNMKIDKTKKITTHKYPTNILSFNKVNSGSLHPTQKPVDLLEYLIKTYSNEGDTVLDFTMGSGSTGVACKNTGRKFIGIELDEKYFKIAKERIEKEI